MNNRHFTFFSAVFTSLMLFGAGGACAQHHYFNMIVFLVVAVFTGLNTFSSVKQTVLDDLTEDAQEKLDEIFKEARVYISKVMQEAQPIEPAKPAKKVPVKGRASTATSIPVRRMQTKKEATKAVKRTTKTPKKK